MDNQKKAYIYAGIAVFFWSTVATAFKLALRSLDTFQLLLIASSTSAVVLFLLLLLQKKLVLLKDYSGREYAQALALGLLNPFLYYTVLFKAYDLLQAQEAQTLNYSWQIMLMLLSVPLLKQKINYKNIISVITCFLGVLVIATKGHVASLSFSNPLGTSLALGSSIVWALFWIYNVKGKMDPLVKLFLGFTAGFAAALVCTLIFSSLHFTGGGGVLAALYVGVFEMGVTFAVWSRAMQLTSTAAKVSRLIYLAPFISLIFLHFIIGEQILLSTVIGLLLIIGGLLI